MNADKTTTMSEASEADMTVSFLSKICQFLIRSLHFFTRTRGLATFLLLAASSLLNCFFAM